MATKKYLSLERLTEYDELIKAEISKGDSSTLASAKSHTSTEIAKITNGTTVVSEANHAVSADSASTAGALTTARTITLAGDTSGSVSFDGSKDVTLTITVKDDSHNHIISNVDGLQSALDGKASSSHNHDNDYDAKGSASSALASAKTYADTAATTAAAQVKNDLLNGAGTAYDTLKELGDLIVDNTDAIEALETIASGKADAVHTHAIVDVSGLQTALDSKAAASHGTHVSFDSTNKPKMDGTAAFGTSTKVARADHIHPTDTSRASKTEFDTHVADTTAHITSTERTNWGTAYTHSQASHAPSNAEKNQNAFSNITVGTTTVSADTATDTITFAGSNMTITPDATNDKITFSVATGSTSTAGILKLTNSTSSTSTTTAATPNSVKSAYDLANTANTAAATAQATADGKANASHTHTVANITDLTATATELNYMDGVTSNVQTQLDGKASSGHTHSDATTSTSGFMTAAMVTKLNGIATGANKITVDSALSSSSTNPVQNKVVNVAISTLTSTVSANTSSISSHTTAIEALQEEVAGIVEITSAEIQALFA